MKNLKRIEIGVTKEVYAEIKKEADKKGVPVATFIRLCVFSNLRGPRPE